MDVATQHALLARIDRHRAAGRDTDAAPSSMRVPIADYTDPDRLDRERTMLSTQPTLVGLSGLLPGPNTYATVDVGDDPVVLTRGDDGMVTAMFNVCRHRGAPVAEGCGAAARLTCPYHGWTYRLDGSPTGRRRAEFFDDVERQGLTALPVLEQHGLLWVSADPAGSIGADPLDGAAAELAPFELAGYRLHDATAFTRPFNWKLGVDTFCEAYHLTTLHRDTLAPMIHDDFALFDAFGPHGRLVAVRRSIRDLDAIDGDDRRLVGHATLLWFLVPNSVLIYQQDHVQLYQARPGAYPGETHLSVAVYVPGDSTRSEQHWRRNFDLLVGVTDTEDFGIAAGIQRGYGSRAQSHVVFGRNEPALQHFHRSIDELVSVFGADMTSETE